MKLIIASVLCFFYLSFFSFASSVDMLWNSVLTKHADSKQQGGFISLDIDFERLKSSQTFQRLPQLLEIIEVSSFSSVQRDVLYINAYNIMSIYSLLFLEASAEKTFSFKISHSTYTLSVLKEFLLLQNKRYAFLLFDNNRHAPLIMPYSVASFSEQLRSSASAYVEKAVDVDNTVKYLYYYDWLDSYDFDLVTLLEWAEPSFYDAKLRQYKQVAKETPVKAYVPRR